VAVVPSWFVVPSLPVVLVPSLLVASSIGLSLFVVLSLPVMPLPLAAPSRLAASATLGVAPSDVVPEPAPDGLASPPPHAWMASEVKAPSSARRTEDADLAIASIGAV
jgi:hypothetical protein